MQMWQSDGASAEHPTLALALLNPVDAHVTHDNTEAMPIVYDGDDVGPAPLQNSSVDP